MTYQETIEHFGTQTEIARVLGITQGTVSSWNKVVPPRWQFQLEVITHGALRVDNSLRVERRHLPDRRTQA